MSYDRIQKDNGTSVNEMLGKSIATDGYYSVVGGDNNKVFLYKRDLGGVWRSTEISPVGVGSSFGDSVAIYNNTIVVGEPEYSTDVGRIFIIDRDDVSSYITFDGVSGDLLGCAVSIYKNYIVAGAKGRDGNKGCVYIYEKNDSGAWSSSISNPILPTVENSNDYFGGSVGINNHSAIIGAFGNNNKTGCVYTFIRDIETNEWEQSQQILASDGSYNDEFGCSISVDGDYFAVGARKKSFPISGENNAGAVYIYKYSSVWYEIDKLNGSGENSYEGNYFGESICLNRDFLVVGSPEARSIGVADIFCKKKGWSHFKKIVEGDVLAGDSFGKSVSISGRFILIGATGDDTINTDAGSIYLYENTLPIVRLAQEFDVNGEFVPSKASVHFKRFGKNDSGYWPIYKNSPLVIDSTNFSTLSSGDNIILFDDSLSGFTGNGYMILMDNSSSFKTINYPIRAVDSGVFYLWVRCLSSLSDNFVADILLDGFVLTTITEITPNPSAMEWVWVGCRIMIPDTQEHILGIKIKENGVAIDKIYIDYDENTPYSEGPDYTLSPYLTIHMRVFTSNGQPDNALYVYDYKNTITEIVCDGWYNFNIKVLDTNHGYMASEDFVGSYFLVLSSSGTRESNFVVWEMLDNDEYMTFPSAMKY